MSKEREAGEAVGKAMGGAIKLAFYTGGAVWFWSEILAWAFA
ncbi:hypothetical protein [Roseovarius sp.]